MDYLLSDYSLSCLQVVHWNKERNNQITATMPNITIKLIQTMSLNISNPYTVKTLILAYVNINRLYFYDIPISGYESESTDFMHIAYQPAYKSKCSLS